MSVGKGEELSSKGLRTLGVSLMIIAVDNLVAATVSQQMGLSKTIIITGPDLRQADRFLDPILCRYSGGTAMI